MRNEIEFASTIGSKDFEVVFEIHITLRGATKLKKIYPNSCFCDLFKKREVYNFKFSKFTNFSKGGTISEKMLEAQKIFQITLLNYSIQYMTLTKCQLSIFFCIYKFNLCTGSEAKFRGYYQ